MMGAHIPENTVLWRDPLQPSPGTVPVPAGSPVIRDGRRVRLDRTEHAWVFTIPSSRAALGVPDHSLTVALDGSWAICSCGACVNRDRCTLVDNPTAILRHHGLLPPADPGGAALDAAQGALDGEAADWRDELPPNFGTVAVTPEVLERAFGPTGTPPLAAVGVSAWGNLPATLDEAVADDGDRWIQSRTAAGVRLVCASCGAVRGWSTGVGAIDWLATDGVCGCHGPAREPTPAQARRPTRELLADLYGPEVS
jgi:hypothetical protein